MENVRQIVADLGGERAPILSVLLAVQDANERQYVDEETVNEIARALKVPRNRIYSTASFYNEISLKPRGLHLIRICRNAPCDNAGKRAVREALEAELGIVAGETTPDGRFTLETVSCLGGCYMSPAIKIDDEIYGDMTPQKAVALLNEYRGRAN